MQYQKYHQKISKWLRLTVILGMVFFIFGGILITNKVVYALPVGVIVNDPSAEALAQAAKAKEIADQIAAISKNKSWSFLLHTVIQKAINKIAYDTASWIGSGAEGRDPTFFTKDNGKYWNDLADEAGGDAIEQISAALPKDKDGNSYLGNLCNPSLAVKMRIGLGLVAQSRPAAPNCTFSKMKDNWVAEQERIKADLNDPAKAGAMIAGLFSPDSNMLLAELEVTTNVSQVVNQKVNAKKADRAEGGGWKMDLGSISGAYTAPPGTQARQLEQLQTMQSGSVLQRTGDMLVDAANVFVNQLAMTLFQRAMKELVKPGVNHQTNDSSMVSGAGFSGGNWGGVTGSLSDFSAGVQTTINEAVLTTLNPDNSELQVKDQGFDLLTEIASCPNPSKPTPSTCVINNSFRDAIQQQLTIQEAVNNGKLSGKGKFGFGFVNNYTDLEYSGIDFPYRSINILRKYRILPVGWELAAQKIVSMNLGRTYTLQELMDCYSEVGKWCSGLVDPNWVLKASPYQCYRKGYGSTIVSSQITNDQVNISRNSDYCSEEKSCIVENTNGTCATWGDCTEERRGWKMDAPSCDPVYNTCQTFQTSNGNTASYLINTLNFNGCEDANAMGCREYAPISDYNVTTGTSTYDSSANIYLNESAQSCDSSNEGCHAFIRTKETGVNLLKNASFEYSPREDGFALLGTSFQEGYIGDWSLKLTPGLVTTTNIYIGGEEGFDLKGEGLVFSFAAKNCQGLTVDLGDENKPITVNSTNADNWSYYEVAHVFALDSTAGNVASLKFNNPNANTSCLIDAVKLERGAQATAFSDYGANGIIYEKLMPDYLTNVCVGANQPEVCNKFVNYCAATDVGCELYTSADEDFSIPAKPAVQDACPAECVGYKNYIQSESQFFSPQSEYFIPQTAKTCSADVAGCTAFTNLENASANGEGKEYFSYLWQCVKPDNPNCAEFYSWQGTNDSGYQLHVYHLVASSTNEAIASIVSDEPKITKDDSADCNANIYQQIQNDSIVGLESQDCRQFIGKSGKISYHSFTNTISCSDNCHAYRMDEKNFDTTITSSTICAAMGADHHWDIEAEQCVACKNGGVYDTSTDACIYHAVPDEGYSCQPEENGCREYKGPAGNNVMSILNDNNANLDDWYATGTTRKLLSDESFFTQNGKSLLVTSTLSSAVRVITKRVPSIFQGGSYKLSFYAKPYISTSSLGAANKIQYAQLITGAGTPVDFDVASNQLQPGWLLYTFYIKNFQPETDGNEYLAIAMDGDFFIANIKLTMTDDRYYLIKDSWNTPASCDQGFDGAMSPLYMLGCQAYQDRAGNNAYFHQFSSLCQESGVGCELMIDTHNTAVYGAQSSSTNPNWKWGSTLADNYVYVIYDENKLCEGADKGCERLGVNQKYAGMNLYDDAFVKNDPERYGQIQCLVNNVGCDRWLTTEASPVEYHFKNPYGMTCELRTIGTTTKWVESKVKRCDATGDVCLVNANCVSGKCILETNKRCSNNLNKACAQNVECGVSGTCIAKPGLPEYRDCTTMPSQTLGDAGHIGSVVQPGGDWTGVCSAAASECTEFVDPLSELNVSHLSYGNNTFLSIKTNTLYSVTAVDATKVYCDYPIKYLASDNRMIDLVNANQAAPFNNGRIIFSTMATISTTTSCHFQNDANATASISAAREVMVQYAIKGKVNKGECGATNLDNGCVGFDERSFDNNGVRGLPTTSQNYNEILKVRPDRVCSQWFSCLETVKQPDGSNYCSKIGACDEFVDGVCVREKQLANANQTYYDTTAYDNIATNAQPNLHSADIANMTGIVRVGWYYPDGVYNADKDINVPFYYPNGLYPLAIMGKPENTIGAGLMVLNSGFEGSISTTSIDNWTKSGPAGRVDLINSNSAAKQEGVCNQAGANGLCEIYAPEGNAFVKIANDGALISDAIIVSASSTIDYVLSFYVYTNKLNPATSANPDKGHIFIQNYSGSTTLVPLGDPVEITTDLNQIIHNPLINWQQRSIIFHTNNPLASYIKIILSYKGAGAAIYFDDVKIKSALKAKTIAPNTTYNIMPSCRQYPEESSLSCDYIRDQVEYRGWQGYCLEYDRLPGDPKACLAWWPAPFGAYGVNQFCGDALVNGNEKCDCPGYTKENGTVECRNINVSKPGASNINNQYECNKTCYFTGGYCGDGKIYTTSTAPYLNEQCDIGNVANGLAQSGPYGGDGAVGETKGTYVPGMIDPGSSSVTKQYYCGSEDPNDTDSRCKWPLANTSKQGYCGDGVVQANAGENCDCGGGLKSCGDVGYYGDLGYIGVNDQPRCKDCRLSNVFYKVRLKGGAHTIDQCWAMGGNNGNVVFEKSGYYGYLNAPNGLDRPDPAGDYTVQSLSIPFDVADSLSPGGLSINPTLYGTGNLHSGQPLQIIMAKDSTSINYSNAVTPGTYTAVLDGLPSVSGITAFCETPDIKRNWEYINAPDSTGTTKYFTGTYWNYAGARTAGLYTIPDDKITTVEDKGYYSADCAAGWTKFQESSPWLKTSSRTCSGSKNCNNKYFCPGTSFQGTSDTDGNTPQVECNTPNASVRFGVLADNNIYRYGSCNVFNQNCDIVSVKAGTTFLNSCGYYVNTNPDALSAWTHFGYVCYENIDAMGCY